MEYSLEDFVEMFNNDDLDVEKYFNDYDTFFSILKRKGLMGEIDPHNAGNGDVWQNHYLIWLYNNDKPEFYKWMEELLNDIDFKDQVYWEGDREDLARLFCDGARYDMSRDTVESILKGDDVFEPYWDTTEDVVRDVIEELTPQNLELFKQRVLKELEGKQLSPETEEMELIAAEQGHEDFWVITPDNVARIIDNNESIKSLLKDELSDIKSDLYSIHSSAYNSAYEHEVYENIFDELDEYFDTKKGEWVYTQHPYKKDVKVEKYRLPIRDFEGLVVDYLDNNKGYGNSGTLEYHGSFLGIMEADKDCLSAQAPDYPDHRLVDKNINEYFGDHF